MNCWILSTVRTGSSYLCDLLNHTNLFKTKFSEKFSKLKTREEAINNLPNISKVHYSQFKKFFQEQDKSLLESILPNLKYILLSRDDRIAQTVSFCIAKKSKTFYLYNDLANKRWQNTKIKLSDKELLNGWKELGKCNERWNDYLAGTNFLSIEYESLINNPKETLEASLTFMEIKFNKNTIENAIKNSSMFRMTKPENEFYINRLKYLNTLN